MSRGRTEMDRLRELVRLHRMGESAREVSRLLRMGPNTERRYRTALAKAGLLEGPLEALPELEALKSVIEAALPPPQIPAQQTSSLEEWRDELVVLHDKGLQARAAYDRLRVASAGGPRPFLGSYSAVKRFWRQLRKERGVRAEDVAIPVVTAPGEVAQVDFGYAGKLYDPAMGVLRKAWVFVMVLCHSRHQFVYVVFDQKVETWLRLHELAFTAFGGVVETVVPDNLKSAVVRAAFMIDGGTELNRSYRELAEHYGFKVDPTPPYSPKKKGKVEAGVKYVRRNGLQGREGESIDEVQPALATWNMEVAAKRVHGSTGRVPLEVFEAEEREALRPLPSARYELAVWKKAKVHPDTHVVLAGRLYSVPWQLVGQEVWIRAAGNSVVVYHRDERVATHTRTGLRRSTQEAHLPEHRRDLRHRGEAFWEERAGRIGPATLALVREIFASDAVLSQLRKVQAIVTYLEQHPAARAERASLRARHYGNLSYGGMKQILTRGLDLEPLPDEAPLAPLSTPRFARSARDFDHQFLEEDTHDDDGRTDPALEEAAPVRRAADA